MSDQPKKTPRRHQHLEPHSGQLLYSKNPIAEYEGYYAAVMYAYLCSLGIDAIAEDTGNRGRIDLTLRFKQPDGQQQVYIFEFKVIDAEDGDGSALRQLQEKDYAAKYMDGDCRIFLVGIELSKVVRNIVGFEWLEYEDGTD